MNVSTLTLPFIEPAPATTRSAVVRLATPVIPESTTPATGRRRAVWLALHFDHLPLCAALESLSPTDRVIVETQPIAVTQDDQRRTVVTCNTIAASAGIRPGHSLNAAIALCANTAFVSRQPDRETELLRAMAQTCERFTPLVSVQPPNELLLEVRGSFKLFGGLQQLVAEVRRVFDSQGRAPRVALSSTSQSALWLSRAATSPWIVPPRQLAASIARLPVAVLHWPADIELRLAHFGVLSIGDLLRLPRSGLARRIGHSRLAELDYAVGRHPQVRAVFRGSTRYVDQLLLDFEIETTQLLGEVIARRLSRLETFLTARQLAVEHVVLELQHREARSTVVTIGLATATANVAHVVRLMQERLSQLQLCAPVRDVTIRVDRLRPAPTTSLPLFDAIASIESTTIRREQQARLLEQLRARLGDEAIRCVKPAADYRPECAHTDPMADMAPSLVTSAMPAALAPRPFWLLTQPQPIPLRPSSQRPAHLVRGPEIIESGWWDGHPVVRAYFHARSPQGALGWICRDRGAPNSWHLHGLYG